MPAAGYIVSDNVAPIDRMYVWMSRDKNGNEGVMAVQLNGAAFPCVVATEHTARMLQPEMEKAAAETGMTMVLQSFTRDATALVTLKGPERQ